MKKGTRICVTFEDITADLHTDKDLDVVIAEVCGWVLSDTKKVLKLATCRYKDGCSCKDRISIPSGCVIKKEVI
ncbi:MAG: hypothetical protein ACYTFK_12540 [Planctomycetota bacterium]|jgi:hypothetical protein